MKALTLLTSVALFAGALAPEAAADGRFPGSVLVYPVHRSGASLFSILCLTKIRSKAKNRRKVLREIAADLDAQGMVPDQLMRLRSKARQEANGDPCGLLAHWLDTGKETLSTLLELPDEDMGQKHRADYDAWYQALILKALLERQRQQRA